MRRLAALPILAVLASKRADGSIQLNPIWFEFRDGFFWVNSNTSRAWPKNVSRSGTASLLLMDPQEAFRYAHVQVRLVDVMPDPQHAFIDQLARRYTSKRFRELKPGEERITLKLEPIGVTGDLI